MTSDEAEKRIQEYLAQARRMLIKAGDLADEQGIMQLDFMGLVFEGHFSWFCKHELQEPSSWNVSSCVIGSKMDQDGEMKSWEASDADC